MLPDTIDFTLPSRIAQLIEYKAKLAGIAVEYVSEEYASQTCPVCGHRHKPANRNFKCSKCGYEYHRDGKGTINTRKKDLGCGQVVAALAPAVGERPEANLRGHGLSPWKLALSL